MSYSIFQYYEESQTLDAPKLTLACLIGGVVALITGYLYALLAYVIPFPYVIFFLAVGLGMLLGLVARLLCRFLKIKGNRSRLIVLFVTLILTYYFHWVAYLMMLTPDSSLSASSYLGNIGWILSPDLSFFRLIGQLSEFGAWSIFGIIFSGVMLIMVWIAEMGVIVVAALKSGARGSIIPFSEQSNAWYRKMTLDDQFRFIASKKALEKEITANGVVGFIDELGQGLGNQHSRIHIYQDDNSNHQYLTLEKVTISNRDQGSEVRYPVIENLKITNQEAKSILAKHRNHKEKWEVF